MKVNWKYIRIPFYVIFFMLGLFFPDISLDLSKVNLVLIFFFQVIPFIILPSIIILTLVTFQLNNPFIKILDQDKKIWDIPNHNKPFFSLINPLLFWHFSSYLALSSGSGFIISCFWRGFEFIVLGLIPIAFFIGVNIAIKICLKTFNKNFK